MPFGAALMVIVLIVLIFVIVVVVCVGRELTKEELKEQAKRDRQDYVSTLPWVQERLGDAVSKENFIM